MSIAEDELLKASQWRSVSEIPNFPFKSFSDVQQAVAEGQCYISVDSSRAYQFAPLFDGPVSRAVDTLLSNVPFLAAIACVILAIFFRDAWLLIGVPAALLAFVVGSRVNRSGRISLWRVTCVLLFGWLLLSAHTAAAWIVASYLISVYALHLYRSLGVAAVNSAARRSEPQFLFALSQGLCGLRDKATNEFIGAKPWEVKS